MQRRKDAPKLARQRAEDRRIEKLEREAKERREREAKEQQRHEDLLRRIQEEERRRQEEPAPLQLPTRLRFIERRQQVGE
jgi:hypothetical protein